jgi:flagellar FliL protein
MTDATADQTATAQTGAGRPRGRRLLVLGAAGLLTLLAAGAGLWVGLGRSPAGAVAGQPKAAGTVGAAGADTTALQDFDEMVVNINGTAADGTPTTRYLKIRLEMVYRSTAETEAAVRTRLPYLRDAVLTYLRQLSEDDLRGTGGLFLLKAELLKRARAVMGSDAPQDFLIGELVMQ